MGATWLCIVMRLDGEVSECLGNSGIHIRAWHGANGVLSAPEPVGQCAGGAVARARALLWWPMVAELHRGGRTGLSSPRIRRRWVAGFNRDGLWLSS